MNAQYTWTFSEHSLLIRLYCWVYEPDRSRMSFCKLFWGTLLFPITLTLRVLIAAIIGAALATRWTFQHSGVPWLWGKWSMGHRERSAKLNRLRHDEELGRLTAANSLPYMDSTSARVAALAGPPLDESEAWKEGWKSYAKRYLKQTEPEPEPTPELTRPNLPSRIAESVGSAADRVAAFLQAHPQIGQRTSAIFATAGKVVVRGVFYPIMILVPIATFVFAGLELVDHWHGPVGAGAWLVHAVWHIIVLAALIVGLWLGIIVGSLVAGFLFVTGSALMIRVLDRVVPYNEERVLEKIRQNGGVPRKDIRDHYEEPKGLYAGSMDILADRMGPALAPVGRVVALPFRALWWVVAGLFVLLARGVLALGHGTAGAGRFLVAGHHAVKYRTCPKIEIVEGDR